LILPSNSEPVIDAAVETIGMLRTAFRNELLQDAHFNHGSTPPFLVIGRGVARRFQERFDTVGACLYDLAYAANAHITTGESLVNHLNSLLGDVEALPDFNPQLAADVDGPLEHYYKPIHGQPSPEEFVRYLNMR
jgi:hypothetical protein